MTHVIRPKPGRQHEALTTGQEILLLLARHRESRGDYSGDILDLRYELKNLITREDWNKIFGVVP